ncbi:MAG: 30S ribosomal protein S21 [Patescibacteria group bacterium]
MIEIKRKDGESISAFLFRFSKKIKQSGVLREAKKRRYRDRKISKTKRKVSALHRESKRKEFEKARKMEVS